MRKFKRLSRKAVSLILALLMLVSIVPLSVLSASAATYNYYWKTSPATSTRTLVTSLSTAWSKANSYANGVVGILADTTCDTLVITKGRNITLELNGYVLNRGRINSSKEKDYNVISVTEGSTLSVYGGTYSSPKALRTPSATVWSGTSKVSRSFANCGIITGGYNTHNGGGINVEKNGKLNLYYTAVAGNRADDAWNTVGGYGGGIALRGDYAKLNMYNSHVSYNYCEVGGGICARDSAYATIYMENTKIDYNTAEKEGGGIASSGSSENFKIEGDGDRDTNSKSRIYLNTAANEGGGVYFGSKSSVVKNMYIAWNKSSGNGGGVYMPKEKTTVKNCYIYYNTSSKKGGGIYNGNDFNTLSAVNVRNNKSTNDGGGVFAYGMGDISLGGKCTIVNNTSTANGDDNLYMDSTINPLQKTYYIKDSLSNGSDIHVRYSSGHPKRLTYFPGTYHADYYTSDVSGYYFKWYSGDESAPDGEKNRNIFRESGTKPDKPSAYTKTLTPDSGKRTQTTSQKVNGKPVIRGVVEFPATANDKGDREGAFYYSDGYFTGNTSYNNHLATMSANLAMAAMYSNVGNDTEPYEYRDKSNNFRQLMSDIGCADEDIYINDFNVKRPTTSSIGVGIASKKIDGENLVIIGVRGAGYEAEWASNVSIDGSGEAGGFSYAAYQVYSELNRYLKRKAIDGKTAKFWISGYSRAGATSNLVAKRIVDDYDNKGERTFAYPIEAPKGGLREKQQSGCNYNCIHNVLNTNDIVPWVAPGEMKFIRYGVDHFVPGEDSASSTPSSVFSKYVDQKADNSYWAVSSNKSSNYYKQKQIMLKQLQSLNEDIVYDDYFHAGSIDYVAGAAFSRLDFQFVAETTDHNYTPEEFIPDFFKKFQAWGFDFNNDSTNDRNTDHPTIKNGEQIRKHYATTQVMSSATSTKGSSFQEAVAMLCGIVFTMPSEQKEQLMNITDGLVDRIGISNILSIYTKYINSNFSAFSKNTSFYDDCETIWRALTELSTEDEAKGYHSLKEYMSEDELDELHTALPALLYPLLTYIGKDYKYEGQDQAGTLAYNAGRLIQNHYPEVAVSWIRSYDTFYTTASIGGDDTLPISINSKDKDNRTSPAKIAAKVKSAAEGTSKTTDGSDSSATRIKVRSLDEVRLVPNTASYENTGEAIYYRLPNARYSFDRVWHGYSDPFVFGNMDKYYYADGGEGNTYTVEAIATHYDKNTKGYTIKSHNSSNNYTSVYELDGTTRTFVFEVESYGVVAYPTSYKNGAYEYSTKNISYGDSHILEGCTPNSTDKWKFVKWTVYPYKSGKKDGGAVADNLLTTYFGGAFDPTKEETTVTNLTDKDFLFEPSYVKVVDSINVNYSGSGDLPDKVAVPELNATDVPVVWSYDKDTNKFTSVFDITLPSETVMDDTINAVFNNYNKDNIDSPSFTYNVTGNTVRFTVTFDCVNKDLVSDYAITVQPYEQNLGKAMTEFNVTYNVLKTGDTVQISAPALENDRFVGWLKIDGISGNETTINIPKQDANGNITIDKITLITDPIINVPNAAGTYQAYYKPIVSEINVQLDKNVKAGTAMPKRKLTTVRVEELWSIDSDITCTWSPDVVNDTADFDTVYSARYELDLSKGIKETQITGDNKGLSVGDATGSFVFADNVKVNIIDEKNNPIDVERTSFGIQNYTVYMDVVFKRTEKAKIESFQNEFSFNVPYKTSASDIKDKLTESVTAALSDNSIVNLPINWNDVPAITHKLEGQEIEVTGEIVTETELKSGLTKAVKAKVNILPASSPKTPEAAPVSGTYNGSTVVSLTSEEGAAIHYTYTTSVKDDEITKIENGTEVKEKIQKPDFGENPSYTLYKEPIDITKLSGFEAGKEIYISAYASKDDMNDSPAAVFTYIINPLEVTAVEISDAKIAVDGIKKACYRMLKTVTPRYDEEGNPIDDGQTLDNSDPTNYRYFSDKNGFNEIDQSEVIDPAFIKAKHTADEENDTGFKFFGFENKTDYTALDLLGVQKRENGEEGNGTSDLRFVTAVDTRILKNAADYGYIISKIDGDVPTYKIRNKADIIKYNDGKCLEFSCKGKDNNISGIYGNAVFDKDEDGYTPYKYVTARITGIDPETKDYTLLARFYVVTEDGSTLVYATYNTSYDGCAANYYKLSHPDTEPVPQTETDPEPEEQNNG